VKWQEKVLATSRRAELGNSVLPNAECSHREPQTSILSKVAP
jgi:hypothetical protein